MKKEYESIEWDKKLGGLIITRQERIGLQDATDIEDAKGKLREELKRIVKQIKALKQRGEEIKSLLNKLDGKADPIIGSAQSPE